jgi:hypothetical protein
MRVVALYALATLTTVAIVGWLFGLHYDMAPERRGIWTAAALATGVQVGAFALARRLGRRRMLLGWVIGAALSLSTLVVFGFVATALGLPLEPTLLSLAIFLFTTELFEPLLLRV